MRLGLLRAAVGLGVVVVATTEFASALGALHRGGLALAWLAVAVPFLVWLSRRGVAGCAALSCARRLRARVRAAYAAHPALALAVGAGANLEYDILAKYVARLAAPYMEPGERSSN